MNISHTNIARTVAIVVSLGLGACVAPAAKEGAAPDLIGGKADGSLEIVDNGPLTFGDEYAGDVAPDLAQGWTFTLSGPATVRFDTSATAEGPIDTILFVHDEAEAELATDDDGGEGYLSSLSTELEAGTYRVAVAGYGRTEGAFGVRGVCEGEGCEGGEPADPWALARDVNLRHAAFTDATPIPESFERQEASPARLGTPEWWQRWSGGATQSFTWSEGTDYGKRCGQASAIRLRAIVEYETTDDEGVTHRPGLEAFERLRDNSNWSGTMYNWTEDVSEGGFRSFEDGMWAWRTSAIKWINVVNDDGSCDLPTLDVVERFADQCLAEAESNDGEFQGCLIEG